MITIENERQFKSDVLQGIDILDEVISWISTNLPVEDVFAEDVLSDWARDWAYDNGYAKVEGTK